MAEPSAVESASDEHPPFVNTVQLIGRVSAETTVRTLPSGDELATWRVVVPRPSVVGQPRRVDSFQCVSFESGIREQAIEWSKGALVDVTGAMRVRFWRSAGGVRSRYELDVRTARRVSVDDPDP